MVQYLSILRQCCLFKNISDSEILQILKITDWHIKNFAQGEAVFLRGSETGELGIVINGSVCAVKYAEDGQEFTAAIVSGGGVIGDVLSQSKNVKIPVNIYADCKCTVMFISTPQLYRYNSDFCAAQLAVLKNLSESVAQKYFALDARVEILVEKSLRAKILKFVETNANKAFSREQLSAYIACERSALCRELSRMKKENIIVINKRKISKI